MMFASRLLFGSRRDSNERGLTWVLRAQKRRAQDDKYVKCSGTI
jgi:hypothetical protein